MIFDNSNPSGQSITHQTMMPAGGQRWGNPFAVPAPQAPAQNWQNAADPTQAYQQYERDYANYVNQYAAYQNSLQAAPAISQLLQSMGTQPQPQSQPMQPSMMSSIAGMVGPMAPSENRGQTWAPGAGALFTPSAPAAPWQGGGPGGGAVYDPTLGHLVYGPPNAPSGYSEQFGLGGGGGGLQRALAGAKALFR